MPGTHNPIPRCALLISCLLASATTPLRAAAHLQRYDKAPGFTLSAMIPAGKRVSLETVERPFLLLFGEPYHPQTLDALTALQKVYQTLGLTEIDVPVLLVVSQPPTPEQAAQLAAKEKMRAKILLDKDQRAFGDYNVIVLPTVAIVDKQGKVSLALSGFPLTFSDIVEDALLFAVGRMTPEQYEASQSGAREAAKPEGAVEKARRLTGLAGQLVRRGFYELALQRYREVLELDGSYVPARLGMARCFLRSNLLPQACEQLQKILQAQENHVEANLLMAQVEIRRGGEEIASAKERLHWLVTVHPSHPQANYLMGTVYEIQGEKDRALEHYKKAAQLLLETDSH